MKKITTFSLCALIPISIGLIAPTTHAEVISPQHPLGKALYQQMKKQEKINKSYEAIKLQIARKEQFKAFQYKIKAQRLARQYPKIAQKNTVNTQPILPIRPKISPISRVVPITRSNIQVAGKIITPNISKSATIDMNRLADTWTTWTNNVRQNMGLAPYAVHEKLNTTAQDWANTAANQGYITHGRRGDGCVGQQNYTCYNFKAVDAWFKERGVNPVVINRSKHTENIGIRRYTCTSGDCTDAAIVALRKTFDFFMSEKSYNGVHYRSIINPHFRKIGVGFAEKNGTSYHVIHYTTQL